MREREGAGASPGWDGEGGGAACLQTKDGPGPRGPSRHWGHKPCVSESCLTVSRAAACCVQGPEVPAPQWEREAFLGRCGFSSLTVSVWLRDLGKAFTAFT